MEASVHENRSEEHKRRQFWEGLVILAAGLGVFLFAFLQSRSPQLSDSESLIGNLIFILLINLNIILLVLLVFLVGRNLLKLFYDRRRKLPGAHLRSRLVLAFLGISLFPAVLLFFIGIGFMTKSIENWFALRVERSLSSSLEVVDGVYARLTDETLTHARAIARTIISQELLEPTHYESLQARMNSEQHERGLTQLVVYSAALTLVANAPETSGVLTAPQLSEDLLERVRSEIEEVQQIVTLEQAELVYGGVPVIMGEHLAGVVVAGTQVPVDVVRQGLQVVEALGEYRQLRILKQPIKNNYVITMFLVTLVVIFSAIWVGVYLAKKITVPLQQLSAATREVAQGHWAHRIEGEGEDEIGTLVSAFNRMTVDLQQSHQELETRRRYMEILLGNINAGVVSFNRDGRLSTLNRAAEQLLRLRAESVVGQDYRDVFSASEFQAVQRIVHELLLVQHDNGNVASQEQRGQLRLDRDGHVHSLLITGTSLPDDRDHALGVLCFFEDVTQIVQVERMEAWREVARRIAHEIKNPLTPIQLAAQRLQRRFGPQITDGSEVFDECVQSIAHEVDAIKKLVNEFSTFARLPAGKHNLHDLNALAQETIVLIAEAYRDLDIAFVPDRSLPLFELDREGMRRVLRNLLDNAVVACREGTDGTQGRIEVTTRYLRSLSIACIEVADNGCGIPPDIKERLFEPYFSTKKDGTGLGLAIVATVVADHQAFIRVRDNTPRGSRFIIEMPVRGGARQTDMRREKPSSASIENAA
ncbi:MAG: ATP-binding protein [Desulfurellaceae bacterium]|nr:ATP-binding protein [Desulfurellaceae bacterium]